MLSPEVKFTLTEGSAFVTGAASGIGRAVAIGIAAYGAPVILADRSITQLDEVRAEIEAVGGRAFAVEVDVTNADQLHTAVRRGVAALGPLRYAVNCAGVADAAPAQTMSREQWQRVYDVDVTGVFLSCQAEFAPMIANGGGAIVNIASMSGSIVNRGLQQVHYNSAKAAVIQLSRSLAMEWASESIRVNAVSPGYTATPMNSRPEMAAQVAQFSSETPLGRYASPSEIAGPVVFLLSPAASYCTGIDLLVDGGFTAW
jgi:NAD(P)-dependent dehydrogenase (short-subunit alcohol dehydrogenase family)